MAHDLVIRNGLVLDGSGRPAVRADVAVDDDQVMEIGRVTSAGNVEVDAEGHVVTPGFVDGHTHMDAQALWDPLGTCSCWHGVTTVVMGNCGFSLAPVRPDARELVIRNLERAEDIPPAALAAGIEWSWETFAEYLDEVDAREKGINYAGYIGHSALRTWAMGERAFEDEATESDLARMKAQVRDALRAGAIGFSTSRSVSHATSDDRPVASRLASWDEVRQLVGVMSDEGAGIFQLALEEAVRSPDLERRAEFLGRLRRLALDTGVPVCFGVQGGADEHLLDLIDGVNDAGGTMFGQSHCRGVASILSFQTRLPFDNLPAWRSVRTLPPHEQLAALADPAVRARLVHAAEHGEYGPVIGAEARRPDFDHLYVMNSSVPPHATVAELARAEGLAPVELMIDRAVATELQQMFIQPIGAEDPELILPMLRHRGLVMTFSDSGAHVSQITDQSIQTHLLAYWVRQRQDLTLPEAVRMLTSVPAAAWGLRNRGRLAEGMVADINVFDPDTVAPAMPEVVYDLPGGARRLRQEAVGFKATIVGGQVVLAEGKPTGALPGRLLRDGARRSSPGAR